MNAFSTSDISSNWTAQSKPIIVLKNGIKIDFTDCANGDGALDITDAMPAINTAVDWLSTLQTKETKARVIKAKTKLTFKGMW
jgi:hypothetical protein